MARCWLTKRIALVPLFVAASCIVLVLWVLFPTIGSSLGANSPQRWVQHEEEKHQERSNSYYSYFDEAKELFENCRNRDCSPAWQGVRCFAQSVMWQNYSNSRKPLNACYQDIIDTFNVRKTIVVSMLHSHSLADPAFGDVQYQAPLCATLKDGELALLRPVTSEIALVTNINYRNDLSLCTFWAKGKFSVAETKEFERVVKDRRTIVNRKLNALTLMLHEASSTFPVNEEWGDGSALAVRSLKTITTSGLFFDSFGDSAKRGATKRGNKLFDVIHRAKKHMSFHNSSMLPLYQRTWKFKVPTSAEFHPLFPGVECHGASSDSCPGLYLSPDAAIRLFAAAATSGKNSGNESNDFHTLRLHFANLAEEAIGERELRASKGRTYEEVGQFGPKSSHAIPLRQPVPMQQLPWLSAIDIAALLHDRALWSRPKGGPLIVRPLIVSGDSMMRNVFLRFVAAIRGQAIVSEHPNHEDARYRVFANGTDVYDILPASSTEQLFNSLPSSQSFSVSTVEGVDESVMIDMFFLWDMNVTGSRRGAVEEADPWLHIHCAMYWTFEPSEIDAFWKYMSERMDKVQEREADPATALWAPKYIAQGKTAMRRRVPSFTFVVPTIPYTTMLRRYTNGKDRGLVRQLNFGIAAKNDAIKEFVRKQAELGRDLWPLRSSVAAAGVAAAFALDFSGLVLSHSDIFAKNDHYHFQCRVMPHYPELPAMFVATEMKNCYDAPNMALLQLLLMSLRAV